MSVPTDSCSALQESATKGRLEVFLDPVSTPRYTKLTLNLGTLSKFGLSYLLTMSLRSIALALLLFNWFASQKTN